MIYQLTWIHNNKPLPFKIHVVIEKINDKTPQSQSHQSCGGLNENVPLGPCGLALSEGVTLMEEMCQLGGWWTLRSQMFKPNPVSSSFPVAW